jgi:hypothetical protein
VKLGRDVVSDYLRRPIAVRTATKEDDRVGADLRLDYFGPA